ncbi:MAG: hypothetical protein GF400_01245 [Candidatus Eisenbacteria bacterium]|nr:hypothetical protein [Candidatus Eisenbacteria bacterium]
MDRPVARRARKRSALYLTMVCLLSAGCAAAPNGGERAPDAPAYPEWVRMVPAPTEEASHFVGACSRAADLDEAVRIATDEASEEITRSERVRYMRMFDVALKDSRTRLTAIETRRLRNEGSERYAQEAVKRAERVDTYHRSCPEEAAADGGAESDVCEVFVLVRLGREERNAALRETLLRMREAFRAEGNTDLSAVAEAMQRAIR